MNCEICNKEHIGNFGSGRFCSKSCANTRVFYKDTKDKISASLKNRAIKRTLKDYMCSKCGSSYSGYQKSGKCELCRRKVHHTKNIDDIFSIIDISKRTISKILKRANRGCELCEWKEATCDIHHIIHKANGGTDSIDNLIILCPNCHRISHSTTKFTVDYLSEFSIKNKFSNWVDYYHPSN